MSSLVGTPNVWTAFTDKLDALVLKVEHKAANASTDDASIEELTSNVQYIKKSVDGNLFSAFVKHAASDHVRGVVWNIIYTLSAVNDDKTALIKDLAFVTFALEQDRPYHPIDVDLVYETAFAETVMINGGVVHCNGMWDPANQQHKVNGYNLHRRVKALADEAIRNWPSTDQLAELGIDGDVDDTNTRMAVHLLQKLRKLVLSVDAYASQVESIDKASEKPLKLRNEVALLLSRTSSLWKAPLPGSYRLRYDK